MNHSIVNQPPAEIVADALVVPIFSEGVLGASAKTLDTATSGMLTRLVEINEINGKPLEVTTILVPAGIKANRIVAVGMGDADTIDRQAAFRAAGAAANSLADKAHESAAFLFEPDWPDDVKAAAVAGSMIGCVGQDLYQQSRSTHPIGSAIWPAEFEMAISIGEIMGDAINLTRQLVNEPPSALYPESFADYAVAMANSSGVEIEVWDEERLRAEKCGALLAVGCGSARPPRLAIMRHRGGADGDPTLALVGKGVTFDSGGLSLKPNDGMKTMKCDMAGAGAVVGAMQAIGQLELPVNVLGIIGMVENMPSRNAYKLGDVLTARNGTTIEVHNTDAEGRLVLADALCVAVEQGADRIIDLATLTGACVVALGEDICGLMTNDDAWCNQLKSAAATTGEAVWELPMTDEFGQQIKSKIADIKNTGNSRWGGAMTAAKLLEHFVDEVPWVHIDIAGPSFYDSPKAWADAGASGVMVQTLVEVARDFAT